MAINGAPNFADIGAICGIGHDIVAIARIENAHKRFGARFLARTFTAQEQAYAAASAPHYYARLAKRFAAKEACAKALGTGLGAGARFIDIEVVRQSGPPTLHLHGAAAQTLARLVGDAGAHLHLSLSDDDGRASAFVVIEKRARLG